MGSFRAPLNLRKSLVSVNFVSVIFGSGNGCANFMDAWKKCVRSAGKTVSIKFLVLGVLGFFWGGGVPILFYGRDAKR